MTGGGRSRDKLIIASGVHVAMGIRGERRGSSYPSDV